MTVRPEKNRPFRLYSGKYALLGLCATLLMGGYFYLTRPEDKAPAALRESDALKTKAASWVCPMHPHVLAAHPGACPICGMDLVESVPAHPSAHGLSIDTATQQKLGVRLATAQWQMLSLDIHAYGSVSADESLVFNLSSKLEGVIKKLHIRAVGQQVAEGQPIYEVYSPELFKIQFEYVELLKEKIVLMAGMMSEDAHTSDYTMTESEMMEVRANAKSRNLYTEKLHYYDASQLIEELNTTYKPREVVEIRAPRQGFVSKIEVHEGSAIKPMDNLFSFTNTSRVWIDVPLFPDQLAWVKDKDQVSVRLPNSNTAEINAKLQFIAPMVDAATRTVQARLSIDNANNQFLVGSFCDVVIHAMPHRALSIPRSALMRTGKGNFVMQSEGTGHFSPVKVETGLETEDRIEIVSGLQAGAKVATNGHFLLDAAASMNDTEQRMHDHAD